MFKIDFFYFMCSNLAMKQNTEDSRKEFESMARNYFMMEGKEFQHFIAQEEMQFKNICPMIYVENQSMFEDLKLTFSQFYAENFQLISSELEKYRNHFQVYADCMKLLMGIQSETFKLATWAKSKWWGCFKFYSFENYFQEIEKIFVIAYEQSKQKSSAESEEEMESKRISL